MICIRRRSFLISFLSTPVTSCPSKKILPPVGRSSCNRALPVVVLPLPLSPTRPRVSPRLMEKLTPSTALMSPIFFLIKVPKATGKWTFRSCTSTNMSLLFVDIDPARFLMFSADGDQLRRLFPALFNGIVTARMKGASLRNIGQVGRLSLDGHQFLLDILVQLRHRGHQTDGVGVSRIFVDIMGRPLLHDLPGIHDIDSVRV